MTDDLVAWLRGVLAEDEALCHRALKASMHGIESSDEDAWYVEPEWRLADIEAKRAILAVVAGMLVDDATDETAQHLLRLLASAYGARPGYREEWAPAK